MTREELLAQASEYVDLETGRKHRTDKGVARGAYGRRTKDESAMSIYNRVKARLMNKDQNERRDGSYLLEGFDANGLYLPIPAAYMTIAKDYKQEYQGRAIEHTIRRVRTQKAIDLEEYRFNALQEYATDIHKRDLLIDITPDVRGLLMNRGFAFTNDEMVKHFIANNHITYKEWFCFVYYISLCDVNIWTYNKWREHYKCCGGLPLDGDFLFSPYSKPGTDEWHPEFKIYKDKVDRNEKAERADETTRKSVQFIANMRRR